MADATPLKPSDAFANPVWNALRSTHAHLAQTAGLAAKYPIDVAPFAAIAPVLSAQDTLTALRSLHSLLTPGEATYLAGHTPPPTAGLHIGPGPLCLQMHFPPNTPSALSPRPTSTLPSRPESLPSQRVDGAARPASRTTTISLLTCADAPAMVALTDLAFPGFFRANTCRMGNYYGIWHETPTQPRHLIAMAGERLCPFPFRELSGVCTHPAHRGQGYAAQLIARLLADHRAAAALSALHVAASNRPAIDLYLHLGFLPLRELQLHRLTRTSS